MIFDEPVIDWRAKGVLINEYLKFNGKNIFVFYNSFAFISYNEDKIENKDDIEVGNGVGNGDIFISTITLTLMNNTIIKIIYYEPATHIYMQFQRQTDEEM
jgi:hypothetical protein